MIKYSKVRYYMGRHAVHIIIANGKNSLIRHLQSGYVGDKKTGYKNVKFGDLDNAPTRLLRNRRKNNV